jgi:hypothetical protein
MRGGSTRAALAAVARAAAVVEPPGPAGGVRFHNGRGEVAVHRRHACPMVRCRRCWEEIT